MSHKFIAAIVASSIALTALTTTPSFAGSRDRDKALLGIAGVILLGTAIADANKKSHRDRRIVQPHRPRDVRPNVRRHVRDPQVVHPRPLPHRVSRYVLPSQCMRNVETRRGHVRFLGRHCLNNNYRAVNRLPQQCSVRVKTRGKVRNGFAPRCLRQFGYRIGRR